MKNVTTLIICKPQDKLDLAENLISQGEGFIFKKIAHLQRNALFDRQDTKKLNNT